MTFVDRLSRRQLLALGAAVAITPRVRGVRSADADRQPVHARRDVRRSRRAVRSAVDTADAAGRLAPRRRRRHRRLGARRRRGVHVRRRHRARSPPAPTRRTACTPSSTSPARRSSASAPGNGRARPGGSPRRATDPAQLRLAAANCQHFESGFFAAYGDLAAWAPDLVVFLGDFIYEYGG